MLRSCPYFSVTFSPEILFSGSIFFFDALQRPAQIYVRMWHPHLKTSNLLTGTWPSKFLMIPLVGVQWVKPPGLVRPICSKSVHSALPWQATSTPLLSLTFLLCSLISKNPVSHRVSIRSCISEACEEGILCREHAQAYNWVDKDPDGRSVLINT